MMQPNELLRVTKAILNYTNKDVAAKFGKEDSTISRYECGNRKLPKPIENWCRQVIKTWIKNIN